MEMIKGLHQKGVDIHAALAPTSPHIERLRDAKLPVRELKLRGNVDLPAIFQLRKWIKSVSFDIVHGLANKQVANLISASYGRPQKVIAYRGAVGHVSRWDPSCYIKWLNPRID